MWYARSGWLAAAASLATTAALATTVPAAGAAAAAQPKLAAPAVRVNQVGYTPQSPKVAFAMLARPVSSVSFAVIGRHGVVYLGRSADDVGRWNGNYHAVYQLNFSALRRPGSYRIEDPGAVPRAVPAVPDRLGGRAVPPARPQRRALLHLGAGRRQRRVVGP